jgi:hypothetical protein
LGLVEVTTTVLDFIIADAIIRTEKKTAIEEHF